MNALPPQPPEKSIRPYPPAIRSLGQRADNLVLDIGDTPRLSAESGRSHLDQTSLDAAIPGLGIYFQDTKTALLLLTGQRNTQGPHGLGAIEGVHPPQS